jgi:hypothetical protein
MKYERVEGGSAVVVAPLTQKDIMLIRNPGRLDWRWKLVAETQKPGESILQTLKAGLEEEIGLKDIKTELGADGKVARFVDPRIKQVIKFGEPEYIEKTKIPHWRHFYGVVLDDVTMSQLSGERHTIEEDDGKGGIEVEDIQTMKFPLTLLDQIPNLLRQHEELIRSIPQRERVEVK